MSTLNINNDYIHLNSASSDKVVVEGNLGIGTTSPEDKLHVVGNLFIEDGSPEITLETGATHYNWQIAAQENVDAALEFSVGSQDADASNDTFTPKMVILQGGNVGIGTTSPSAKLEVEAASTVNGTELAISNDYGESKKFITFRNGSDIIGQISTYGRHSTAGAGPAMIFDLSNGTSAVERLRITKDGNVGIGTTSPAYKLDVSGTGKFGGDLYNSGTIRTRSSDYGILSTYGSEGLSYEPLESLSPRIRYWIRFDYTNNASYPYLTNRTPNGAVAIKTGTAAGGGENEHFRINGGDGVVNAYFTDANVGIGTNSPSGELHIKSASTNANLYIQRSTYDPWRFSAGSTYLAFMQDASEKMRITAAGNVGIGTTSPAAKLDVAGQIITSDSVRFTGNVSTPTGNTVFRPASNTLAFGTSSTERLRITSSGNVGIGTTSPGSKLDVTGEIRSDKLSNGISFSSTGGGLAFTAFDVYTATDGGLIRLYNESIQTVNIDGRSAGGNSYFNNGGNVGIGTTNPQAPLHVAGSNYKVMKLGNDFMYQYQVTGSTNHTVTLTCGSYYQAEVVITANQTNSGGYNNIYIRGIWSNNHTSHHWDILEEVGFLTGSSFSFTIGQDTVSNSGKLVISHTYTTGSFSNMTVRVTEMYGGPHSYSIT